jgi:sugar lactone lactonase YvrE
MRWLFLLAIACSSSSGATERRDPPAPPPRDLSPAHLTIDLPGDGNGVVWDARSSTLYLTDDTHDQLVAWTDAGGFAPVGGFPAATKVGLGALVRIADGRFVTTSFGFGTDGAVYTLEDRTAATVPNLEPARRRIGLARAPDDKLYVAYFVVQPGSKHRGAVARLELSGAETDLEIPGLAKPVGLAATDKLLYIADQERAAIVAYAFETGAVTTVASELPSADLLTLLPNGDLVTGGKKGAVYRVGKTGAVATIASGFEQVRGTAYDPAKKRLFVIEHSVVTSHHKLHVLPLAL